MSQAPRGSAPGPAGGPGRAGRGRLGAVLLAVAVVAVGAALWRNWAAVRADLALLAWLDLLGSGVAGLVAVACTGLAWRAVLVGSGHPVAVRPALALYSAGQLGKYVPGAVWVVAIQAELGRLLRIPRAEMVLSYLVAVLVAVVTGGLVGLLALIGPGRADLAGLALALAGVAVVLAIAVARPAAVNAGIRWVAARLGRELPRVALPGRVLAVAGAWALAGWLAFGLHAWLLARPLGAGPQLLAPVTGAFALAFVAGLLLVPLPAGAGVREAVLVAMLAGSIGAAGALTVGLVSRLVLVVVDVVLAAAFGVRPGHPGRRVIAAAD